MVLRRDALGVHQPIALVAVVSLSRPGRISKCAESIIFIFHSNLSYAFSAKTNTLVSVYGMCADPRRSDRSYRAISLFPSLRGQSTVIEYSKLRECRQ